MINIEIDFFEKMDWKFIVKEKREKLRNILVFEVFYESVSRLKRYVGFKGRIFF